jgi:hypothetical protein
MDYYRYYIWHANCSLRSMVKSMDGKMTLKALDWGQAWEIVRILARFETRVT